MKEAELIKLCKYYNGESECPYPDPNSSLWWGGEKQFVDTCLKNEDFFEHVRRLYLDALEKRQVSHMLVDMSIAENKRVLIFYLDLWHGKWFPQDSLDAIFDY